MARIGTRAAQLQSIYFWLLYSPALQLEIKHHPSWEGPRGLNSHTHSCLKTMWEVIVFRIKPRSQRGSQGSPWLLHTVLALYPQSDHTGLFLCQTLCVHSCLGYFFWLMCLPFFVVPAGCNPQSSRLGSPEAPVLGIRGHCFPLCIPIVFCSPITC